MRKTVGKVGSIAMLLVMLSSCALCSKKEFITENTPTETKAPPEIVETVRIEPDVLTLLKDSVRYTRDWDNNTSDSTFQISYEDAQRLMKIAEAEAGNQGIDGMLKVMEVVINRVDSSKYPDTIKEVIEQPGQFEPVMTGTYYAAEPSVNAHLALAELEKNLDPDTDIIAFEVVTNSKSLLRYYNYSYTLKGHDFYVERRR